MAPDADARRLPALATIVDDFIAALDLEDVTLVGNDSGGAVSQVLVVASPRPRRPPRPHQLRHLRELPAGDLQGDAAAGQAARRHVDDGAAVPLPGDLAHRLPPPSPRAGRGTTWSPTGPAPPSPTGRSMRDLAKVTAGLDKRFTLAAAASPARHALPPPARLGARRSLLSRSADAERLAAEVGGAKLVRIPDSATFVPFDQPQAVATAISPTLRLRRSSLREQLFAKSAKCRFFVRLEGEPL